MPTFKRWGEGKNSEKGTIRKSRRTREKVMSRKATGGILGFFPETWSEASNIRVCGYIKKHIHVYLLEKHTEAFMHDVWGRL